MSLSAIIVFQDGRTTWKPLWTYPSHVYKDNKFFVYEDNWQRYLYTIEDIFKNKNIDFNKLHKRLNIVPLGIRRKENTNKERIASKKKRKKRNLDPFNWFQLKC